MPGRPTMWMIVEEGPIALAEGADGGCFNFFTLPCLFSHLSLSLSLSLSGRRGRRPDIDCNTVSKGRYTQNNQPTKSELLSGYSLLTHIFKRRKSHQSCL